MPEIVGVWFVCFSTSVQMFLLTFKCVSADKFHPLIKQVCLGWLLKPQLIKPTAGQNQETW